MSENQSIELRPENALAVAPQEGITIQRAFEAAASKSLDKESLAVMRELLAMDAERQFVSAFVQLRKDLPTIVAKTVIPNRGKYERFEDLMEVLQPLLDRYGFCVSFSQTQDEKNRVTATCELMHIAGHKSLKSFTVRSGGKSDSETQADCKATTTAKRGALILTFNIKIRQDCLNSDNDESIEGDPNDKVTQAQADELEHRAKMVNANIPALFAYAGAGVSRFKDIPAKRYGEIDSMLTKKEGRNPLPEIKPLTTPLAKFKP